VPRTLCGVSCLGARSETEALQVEPFGSYANGLAAHSSDIDVVLLGLLQPLASGTGGASRPSVNGD